MQNFVIPTESTSPTGSTAASSSHPFDESFMDIETGDNCSDQFVFNSLERTDIIQISNNTFYCYRLSAGKSKSIGRIRNQLILLNSQLHSRSMTDKSTKHGSTSTEGSLLTLAFTEKNNGVILVYDQIDTASADM